MVNNGSFSLLQLCGRALRNYARSNSIHMLRCLCDRALRGCGGSDIDDMYRTVSNGAIWDYVWPVYLYRLCRGALWRGYGANSIGMYRSVRYWTLLRGGSIFCDECAVSCRALWSHYRFIVNNMYGVVFGWILL